MYFCIYEILYSTEALLSISSDERVQGEGFSMVGFLGLKVLSVRAIIDTLSLLNNEADLPEGPELEALEQRIEDIEDEWEAIETDFGV